nr:hypothetical protein [Pseudomonas sp. UBA2684]|tara:strand:+ start:3658 stop:3882 length:225 start_codon:yes stop_codon:yes gene_type:complete
MTNQDAILALLLAAKIHGTPKAVKNTAKRCAKLLPRSKRNFMFTVAESPRPLEMIVYIGENLDRAYKGKPVFIN